jgi:ribosomal protein S18 acetylase RimI-like enzyme
MLPTMVEATPITGTDLVAGVTVRRLRAPDDYRSMNAIANAERAADGLDWATTDEQFRNFYEHLSNCDPTRDVVIAERNRVMVGYARATWAEESDGRSYFPIAFVDPALDDRVVIMGALFDAMEARIREIAGGHPPGVKRLRLEVGASAKPVEALLAERGYRAVRWEHVMVRPTLDDLPDAPMPDGLEIRDVRPEHLRAIWDAATEAFSESWGANVPTEQDFEQFATDPIEGDTSLWRIAWDGDQVAGMVRSYINPEENERFCRKRGWVENIAVRKPWRRRGLARALIAASFPLLRARGMTEGALGVDSQNESNALRLYESCGFVAVSTISVWEKPLV